jgi:hypothetical protein
MATKNLIIGAGEIGSSLKKFLGSKKLPVIIRDKQEEGILAKIDILHIAIPYSDDFKDIVGIYRERYNPKLTIVYSTVPIGTCEKIDPTIVHSPIEGRHPKLAESLQIFPRWLGCSDPSALTAAVEFWGPLVGSVRQVDSASQTEMLKLRSTAKYGVNLVWADYEKSLADSVGAEWDMVKVFDLDYNLLYEKLGFPEFSRYLLDPPGGQIGGHCVVPNAELLDEQFPHPLLKMIKKMRKK